tara:strand:- start:85 stop:1857 length:1773 start_codon:yes stop_codon:yes gene_type:complete
MAEKIISPGVFTNEVDQSFLPAGVAAIGAAVIGPTAKGPALVPTTVSSYAEFVNIFGGVFESGSGASKNNFKYLTNYSAQEYLKYADTLTVVRVLDGDFAAATSSIPGIGTGSGAAGNDMGGGTAFTLTTLSHGADQKSAGGTLGTNELLPSGSVNNLRYEINNVSNAKGTFNLAIRRGDDTSKRKIILEQYNNVNLDPNSANYIARRIGDQVATAKDIATLDPYIQYEGDYPNRSKLVRVTVNNRTLNYLDENGQVREGKLSGSLPQPLSSSFGGASDGTVAHPRAMYENIVTGNSQGITFASGQDEYIGAIRLLKNQDEYDINLLSLPGVIDNLADHAPVITAAVDMVESRGDCFLVIDPVEAKTTNLADVVAKADGRDTNYAAEYWPWIKIPDNDLGRNVWVPASTVIPSVYAFNDRVAAPWFAPAGLNRGGIDIAVQAERKLTHANRDTLYDASVNPIATFPNAGVTVFGQKTLQKKASALDRVNVRRLLIAAKKFIASSTKFLVFENNTAATRNRFLSIVNPYFENIQQRQGLYAFKVVMDESNNTPDVIDRNEMQGQIFMQPAKTAEFIVVDFNIMATGASFPE